MKKIIAEIFLFQIILVISVNGLLHNNNGCNGIDYSPDEQDCTVFYRCVDYGTYSIKHKFNCGPGTFFDTRTNNCGFPYTVDRPECKRNNIGNDVLSNDQDYDDDQGYNYNVESNELDNNLNPINPVNMNMMPKTEFKCEQEGFFADPTNCMKFIRCVNYGYSPLYKFSFDCGEGTVWDQDLLTCNHPRDVRNSQCAEMPLNSISTTTITTSKVGNLDNAKQDNKLTTESSKSMSSSKSPDNYSKSTTELSTTIDNLKLDTTETLDNSNKSTTELSTIINDLKSDTTESSDNSNNLTTQLNTTNDNLNSDITESPDNSNKSTTELSTIINDLKSDTTESSDNSNKSTTTIDNLNSDITESSDNSNNLTTELSTTNDNLNSDITESPDNSNKSTTTIDNLKSETTDSQEVTSPLSTMSTDSSTVPMSLFSTTIDMNSNLMDTSTFSNDSETIETSTSSDTITTISMNNLTTSEPMTTVNMNSESTDNLISTTDSLSTTVVMNDVTTQTDISTNDNVTDSCPMLDNDNEFLLKCPSNFKRHPKYCNVFYQCYIIQEGFDISISSFQCPDNTVYDETKIQCVPENDATEKCTTEMFQKKESSLFRNAENLTDEMFKTEPLCPQKGYFSLKDNTCTNAFIKCEMKDNKIQGLVLQCPEGYIFWNRSRRCEPISKVFECRMQMFSFRNQLPVETENISK